MSIELIWRSLYPTNAARFDATRGRSDPGTSLLTRINALETGKKKPTIELVVVIAKLFLTTTDWAFDDALEVCGQYPMSKAAQKSH